MKKILLLGLLAFGFIACNNDDTIPVVDGDDNIVEDDNIPQEPVVTNVKTFENVKVAFGEGYEQSAEGTFNFPTDTEEIESIKMYLQDICPNKECDEWDRYANIYVKNQETGEWYEIGRFITPYWVGTELLERGLEFDVTDFKSLLQGQTELKIYTETWLAKGRTYSVEFDFVYGEPDYKYSAVVPVIQYNHSSIDGVPYGVSHNFDMTKNIQLPHGVEEAKLRTIISGWGHATPMDSGGRGCAEWCFRTHHIAIDNVPVFEHKLEPIGCASNPINNQSPGNWRGDRAGWCPGMIVPVREDELNNELIGNSFSYEYQFEDWTSNGNGGNAFYAISTFVVVKSNSPIENLPVVSN